MRTSAARSCSSGRPCALPEPALDAFQPFAVAQAKILVADALAAGQQRVSELQRLEMRVALQRLEPFGRIARAVLKLEHFEIRSATYSSSAASRLRPGRLSTSASLIASSSASLVPDPTEKCAVCGVAQEDDVAGIPAFALDAAEIQPAAEPRR